MIGWTPVLTCSSVNQDTLVGPQVAEVKQHHVGGDVVDREGGGLLEAHALRDEEGVVGRGHHHLLPQPEAVQHHHLITNLEERRRENSQVSDFHLGVCGNGKNYL